MSWGCMHTLANRLSNSRAASAKPCMSLLSPQPGSAGPCGFAGRCCCTAAEHIAALLTRPGCSALYRCCTDRQYSQHHRPSTFICTAPPYWRSRPGAWPRPIPTWGSPDPRVPHARTATTCTASPCTAGPTHKLGCSPLQSLPQQPAAAVARQAHPQPAGT